MSILIQSFGFKRGVPTDADVVFDVRMLPNPHWVKDLRLKSGLDSAVKDFLESQPLTEDLYLDIRRYLDKWLPMNKTQGVASLRKVCQVTPTWISDYL